jgi:DNA invertase Pin-like site-specific DNA recombinase
MSSKVMTKNVSFQEALATVEKLGAEDIIKNRKNGKYTKEQLQYLEENSITYLRPSSNLKRVVDESLPPIIIEYRRRSMKKDKKKEKNLRLQLKAEGLTQEQIDAHIIEADIQGRLVPDDSVSFQRQHMENVRLAKADGYDLENNVLVFEEEGGAFNRNYRPEFERMIKFISEFEGANPIYIYVYEISRLARNSEVWNATVSKLVKQNVVLRSVLEPFIRLDDPTTEMVTSLMSSLAVASSRQTSERMLGSMEIRAKEGVVKGSGCPVGLKVIKKETKIGLRNYFAKDDTPRSEYPNNQSAAWLVEQVFTRYRQGDSATAICQWLNDSGFPTTKASVWNENTIMRMLRNPHYAGYMRYNPKGADGARLPLKMVREQIVKDELGNYMVFFDGIVTPDIFWEVQTIIEGKHKPRARTRTIHKLSGILTCSRCGAQMFGNASEGHPRSYRCPNSFRNSRSAHAENQNVACVPNNIRGEALEQVVFNYMLELLSNQNKLDDLAKTTVDTITIDEKERVTILEEIAEYESLYNSATKPALKIGYKAAIDDATDRLTRLNNRNIIDYRLLHSGLGSADEFAQEWSSGTKLGLQMIIKSIISAIDIHPINKDDRMNLTAMNKKGWITDLRRITITLTNGERVNLAENDMKCGK